jgi:hypothetical protein
MAQDTLVDVKQAVASAQDYLLSLFPTHGRVELEEVEPNANGGWRITFSFERNDPDPLGVRRFMADQGRDFRQYKVVTVDASGNPQSVKIR